MPRRAISLNVALATVFAFTCSGFFAAPPQAQAASASGSVTDTSASSVLRPMTKNAFDEACKNEGYGQGATLVGTQPDAYSIRCVSDDGTLQEFDRPEEIHTFVSDACQVTYPGPSEIDRLSTMGKTYDAWQCATFAGYSGGPDLDGWCKSKGLELINRSEVKYPAYRWFCADAGRSRVEGISVADVCAWQYGENSLDRVFNVYGAEIGDAWDCFYVR